MKLSFAHFPVLSTERLVLRRVEDKDVQQIYRLRSDPVSNAYIGRVAPANEEEAAAHIRMVNENASKDQSIYWVISLQQDPTLIGTICFWNFDLEHATIEIGYEMLAEFQGKGLMAEAIKRVIAYGFDEMKARIILAYPSADNERSVAVLKNTGFKLDPRHYANIHDDVNNLVTYSQTRQ
ncbi:GNAT family N-acetyltransferase [Undibacterium terreum]|uniref:Alanine acetyltransferase n=1 Tax=Undibacterium terreum TaxID=1224302 RepID=A0A916U2N1_9BURK|nr:GNAT family N-acetyltransferase [Undibacterium terreum]GGC58189.1 alanine acetyltransferase [Undibacterium terreum]